MTEHAQAPHLLEEHPILVYPTLAVYMGINKAVVFQQLHFLQNGQKTAHNQHNYIDGKYWVYNSYQQWKDQYFPWLSVSSLKGIFIELEKDDKLITSRQSVKNKSDRRKWYSIDYEAWVSFCTTMRQKLSDGSLDKNNPLVGQELADGYSEGSSETSSEDSSEGTTPPPSSSQSKEEKTPQSATEPPNPLVPALPLSPSDTYIWVWAVISRYVRLDIPASYEAQFKNFQTPVNRKKAKSLASNVIPITVEMFLNYVTTRTQSGLKEVKFTFIVDDCITFVARNWQPPQPAIEETHTEPAPTLTPEETAERVAEYNRIMAGLNAAIVEKTVAA